VPAGNVWLDESAPDARAAGGGGERTRVVANGHAQPVEVTLRFRLPAAPQGYRFARQSPTVSEASLIDVTEDGLYVVRGVAAAGQGGGAAAVRSVFVATPAEGNQPPKIDVQVAEGLLAPPNQVAVGQPVRLDAAATADPDAGDGVLAILWTLPGGATARGPQAGFVPTTAGTIVVRVDAIDRRGARSHLDTTLWVQGAAPPPLRQPTGCGCQIGAPPAPTGGSAAILSCCLALAVFWRHRHAAIRMRCKPIASGRRARPGSCTACPARRTNCFRCAFPDSSCSAASFSAPAAPRA
jgi:hypothetical protein